MATEAADIRVKVSASGVAQTTAELMAVDKAIDMVGDDSSDTNVDVDLLGQGLSTLGDAAIDAAAGAEEAGSATSSMGTSMGKAGLSAEALQMVLKVGLFVALGALLAPLVSIVTTLGALIAGLAVATPAFLALGGALFYVGQQAILTATHTDNLADAWAKLTKEGEPLGEALDRLKAAAKPMADEFMRFIETVGPMAIDTFTNIVGILEKNLQPILDAVTGQLGHFFNFLERTSAKIAPKMDNVINRVGNMMGRLARAFEPAIGPAIDGLLTILEGLADGIKKWLKPMIPFIRPVARMLGDFLRELGKQLGRVAKALAPSMPAFFRMLRNTLKLLGDVLVDIAPDIVEFVKQFAKLMRDPKARKELVDILRLFLDTLTLLAAVMPTIIDLIKPFTDGFGRILDFFKGEFSKENVIETLTFLIALPAWITQKVMQGVQKLFREHGGKWMKALKEGLTKGWNAVKNWFLGIGDAVVRFFNSAKRWLVEKGGDIIDGAMKGISRAWRAVVNWFKRIPGTVKDWFTGAIGWLLQAGKDVIQGFWDGLSDVWDRMSSWIGDKIASLPGFVKDFFGIGSPSKLMRGLGKNVMEGFWRGMSDELPNVNRAVDNAMGAVHGDASLGSGRRGGMSVAAARGRVTGTLRIVGTKDLYAVIDQRVARSLDDDRDFKARRGQVRPA